MKAQNGFVSLASLLLSAFVGLGGLGAIVAFNHNSELLGGVHTQATVSANDDITPSPTDSPTSTPTPTSATGISPTPTPTTEVTVSPTPTITPIPTGFLHSIIRGGDEEEDEGESSEQDEHSKGVNVQTEERGQFGNHANQGLHEGLELQSGRE